jgi:hypothetical protein
MWGLRCGSVVEHLPSMLVALALYPALSGVVELEEGSMF